MNSVPEPRALLESHAGKVRQIARVTAVRRGFAPDEVDDFVSWVFVRIIDNDYRVLRRFRGQSPLPVYLSAVILNLARDYRIMQWGKWRASAAAKRLGKTAVRLERLLYRDGYGLSEAGRMLRDNFGMQATQRKLVKLLGRLPSRMRRGGGAAPAPVATTGRVESRLHEQRLGACARRVHDALCTAIGDLSDEEVQLLRRHFVEGETVASIARDTGQDQRRLYGRLGNILRRLRSALEQLDGGRDAALELSDWKAMPLDLDDLLQTGRP